MKVFSKSKNNKSTPLLHSINIQPHKSINPSPKPKGITKVTSYKNKLAESSNNHSQILINQPFHSIQAFKELSKAQKSFDYQSQNKISEISMINSIGYKTCRSEKNTDQRSSGGSVDKIQNSNFTTIKCLEKQSNKIVPKVSPLTKKISSQNKQNIVQNNRFVQIPKKINHFKNQKLQQKKFESIVQAQKNKLKLKDPLKKQEEESILTKQRILLADQPQYIQKKAQGKQTNKKFTLANFKLGKKLGRGRFGSVFAAQERQTGMIVALKVVDWLQVVDQQMEDQIMEEIKLQTFMSHPNILQMYGFFKENNQLVMILQYAEDKCLFNRLETKMEEKQAAYFTKQMIQALKYCHSESILHRDLKPQNILLSGGVAKLADFGWAAYAPKYKRITFCGTLDYVPPQILKGKYYDQKVDIWSLGVLIYEMVTGKAPFQTYSLTQEHVENKTMARILEGDLVIPNFVSPSLRKLIETILMTEPEKRPSLSQIQQSQWIKSNIETNQIRKDIWQRWIQLI